MTMVSMKPDLFWKIGERGVAPNGRILRSRYTESLWSYREKIRGNVSQFLQEAADLLSSLGVDPLGLAGRSTYLPDISPEELERRIAADTRKAILDEEMEEARITRLLR